MDQEGLISSRAAWEEPAASWTLSQQPGRTTAGSPILMSPSFRPLCGLWVYTGMDVIIPHVLPVRGFSSWPIAGCLVGPPY